MKPIKTWIVIADGAQARVFENMGIGSGLTEVKTLEASQEHMKTGDIMSDRQGRSFSSAGTGRSAMEPATDPAQKRETDFVQDFTKALSIAVNEQSVDRVIIAAAPRALGDIRKAIPAALASKITEELPKDLTNAPFGELPQHFKDIIML